MQRQSTAPKVMRRENSVAQPITEGKEQRNAKLRRIYKIQSKEGVAQNDAVTKNTSIHALARESAHDAHTAKPGLAHNNKSAAI